jgi:predicted outer membrane repeat protein
VEVNLTIISTELDVSNISGKFVDNHGKDGGGVSLYEYSFVIFVGYSSLMFDHNTASRKGGAIFVEDSDYINSHTKIARSLRVLSFSCGSEILPA